MSDNKIHYVVMHRPGANWQQGVDFREQEGIMAHVKHYASFMESGKLLMGGPYLEADSGGMMVAVQSVTYEELDAYAQADPTVQSGLLNYHIVTWYVPMKNLT